MKTRSLKSKLGQFTQLSAVEKQALEDSTGDMKEYAAKEDIIEQGDSPDELHLLVEGWASRY